MRLMNLNESVERNFNLPPDLDNIRRSLRREAKGKINGCRMMGKPVYLYTEGNLLYGKYHFLAYAESRKEISLCDFIITGDGTFIWNDSYVMASPRLGGAYVKTALFNGRILDRLTAKGNVKWNDISYDLAVTLRRCKDGDPANEKKINEIVRKYADIDNIVGDEDEDDW